MIPPSKTVMSTIARECQGELFEDPISDEWIDIRATPQVLDLYPTTCGTKFARYIIGGKEYYEPYQDRTSAAHKTRCPACARRQASKSARRTYHRLMAFHWSNLWAITLTTPKGFVDPLKKDEEGYPEQRKVDFLNLAKKYMRTQHPDVPFMMSFHHWKTSDPLGGPHFHVHITALCATYKFHEGGGLIDKPLDPYVNLKKKKRIWGNMLGLEGNAVLHYQFITRKTQVWKENGEQMTRGGSKKLRHWLNYVYRYYVQDVEKFFRKFDYEKVTPERTVWADWHNRVKSSERLGRLGTVISITVGGWGKRTNGYGALSNRKRKYFIYDGVVQKRIEEENEIISKRYTPDTREPVTGKRVSVDLLTRKMKISEMIIRPQVRYVDYSVKLEWPIVYKAVPRECMRWGEYHSFRSKRKKKKE